MTAALENHALRAKVQSGQVNGRTLVQISALDEDTHDLVELVQPYGYVANPVAGSDVIELHVTAFGSHKVAFAGDNTADSVSNLQPGECGLSRGGQQMIIRLTGIQLIAPLLQWALTESGTLQRLVQEQFVSLFNAHVHTNGNGGGNTGAPTTPMNATHLTGGS